MLWRYIFFGLAAVCAAVYAVCAYRKKTRMGVLTGNMFVSAAVLNIVYLLRINAGTYTAASVCTSIYFICMDLMLLALLMYVYDFTESKVYVLRRKRYLYLFFGTLTFLDCALLAVNIFHEALMSYHYDLNSIYAIKYMYAVKPPFYVHLCFTYLLAGITACVLLAKSLRVPKIYSGRYRGSLIGLVLLMIFTYAYMSGILKIEVDIAVPVYGFLSVLIYRNTFDYTSRGMLNPMRQMILEYMGSPMILFDYEGYVADTNRDMRNLFPELNSPDKRISMMDFMQIASFKNLRDTVTDQVFEWKNPGNVGEKVYQCNFNCLKDEKDRIIGHLLIMKSAVIERDALTSLYSKQSFYANMESYIKQGLYPITIVVCNTNGIGLINDVYGWEKGDELLCRAADLMRSSLPKSAVLARLDDGDMAAGLIEVEQEYADRLFLNIKEQYRAGNDGGGLAADIEYGIAVIRSGGRSVDDAVKEAESSMRTKKLMSETSEKSSLLDSLTQTLTESDYETKEHVERTKDMAVKLGKALHLSDAELGKLELLAVLHDIGKIAIPHSILLKPGKLTDEEWKIMKTHTEKGYRIASASKELSPIAEYILHHHERWDGGGYPGGLKEEEIPLLSRIITVVDSHDVMVHDRPYHKAMSQQDAVQELLRCSGTQFDPHITEVFLGVIREEENALPE